MLPAVECQELGRRLKIFWKTMKVLLKTLFYFLFVILGIKEILLLKLGFLAAFF